MLDLYFVLLGGGKQRLVALGLLKAGGRASNAGGFCARCGALFDGRLPMTLASDVLLRIMEV